jgi:2-polyprenyl-3-methyl-5-hydroxy-6-metoxy-1,4-benzoquinol methylase
VGIRDVALFDPAATDGLICSISTPIENLMQTHQTGQFDEENGVFVPRRRPVHRDEEYAEKGFDVLLKMQRHHFWYHGRHRLLLNVLRHEISRHGKTGHGFRGIDMGGGCGGWLEYLHTQDAAIFQQLAIADSSLHALTLAEPVVGSFASRYQVDLLDLPWSEEWDVVFLLDVLEHIPDDTEVLRQIRKSIRPGGLLFVTTPALKVFWTYNDDLAHHQRRYSKKSFGELGECVGLKLLRAEYFMFFLSPALLLSRILSKPPTTATSEECYEHLVRTHRIPTPPINSVLKSIFLLEASMVNHVSFPWGTSVLAVFQR